MFGERGRSSIIMVASVIGGIKGFLCSVRHFICIVDVWGARVIVRI